MADFLEFISAVREGHLEEIKRMFKSEYIDRTYIMGWTALHCSCGFDRVEVVRFLLDQGWNIELGDAFKYRPIHLAAFKGHADIVEELMERKCLLDVSSNFGETPLDMAINNKFYECAELLRGKRKRKNSKRPSLDQSKPYMKSPSTAPISRAPSISDFKKGNLLGEGTFGKVFRCLDQNTGRDFVMKEVVITALNSANSQPESLENEINIYKKLSNHPRIVQYFGTTTRDNVMLIFMEYMAGGSIRDVLNEHGALSPSIISRYSKQILEGLCFLHQNKIIHRDVKAANIMRDIDGNVKLADFGISRCLENVSLDSIHQRGTCNSICGTKYWMAPEVIRGEQYSVWADVWSFGATVVEMLTSKQPYHWLEPQSALFKIGYYNKIEYECSQPIPDDLQNFLNQMLEADPRKRANIGTLLKSDFIRSISDKID